MINKDELMDQCLDKAVEVAMILTEQSKEELHAKLLHDPKLHASIRHIASLYYGLKINEDQK